MFVDNSDLTEALHILVPVVSATTIAGAKSRMG